MALVLFLSQTYSWVPWWCYGWSK